KAFDEIIDGLSRFLAQEPPGEVERLLPRTLGAVPQIFPVLGGVIGAPDATAGDRISGEPHQMRRAVFAWLREILRRTGERRPLVLHIDDLHWADEDSLLLLEALLRSPGAPALLLVATMRSASAGVDPDALAARVRGDVRRIHLDTLPP